METNRLVDIRRIADHLGLKPNSLYRMLKTSLKDMPRIKIGSLWRFDLDEVDKWVNQKRGLMNNGKAENTNL